MLHRIMFLTFLLCTAKSFAQDTIFYKDGTLRFVKVLEIGEEKIKYKNSNNLDGPDYITNKSSVQRIGYKNGTSERFDYEVGKETNEVFRQRRNSLSINTIDLITGMVSLAYERSLSDSRYAFNFSLSTGIRSWESSGRNPGTIEILYYSGSKPIGGTFTTFFYSKVQNAMSNLRLGPEFGAGIFYYYKNTSMQYLPYKPNSYVVSASPYYSFGFDFGFKIIPIEHFFLDFDGVFGAQFTKVPENSYNDIDLAIQPYARIAVNVGYRF